MSELDRLAARVAARLVARGESIAIAESSTGGLISAALLAQPGASRYFAGGGVIYTRAAREGLLGLTPEVMAGRRSTTEPYALLLAATARTRLGASWGLGETGAAGPSGNAYGDAAGTVCVAVSGPAERSRRLVTGSGDRVGNMQAFGVAALQLLEEALTDD